MLARSGSMENHDYTPAPAINEKECIELNPNEEEKDKDYYFMDTSLLGQLGINLYRLIIINCQFLSAGERVKPIPVSEFSSHVERLHADRDKLFEMEYEVSGMCVCVYVCVCVCVCARA